MSGLILGIVGTSSKENERRLPVHPRHLDRIAADLRSRIVLERGYGELFGVPDDVLGQQVDRLVSRDELFASSDVVLLPKPMHGDVEQMRDGQVLWGWPHLVQDPTMTQLAIDKHLTFIAWEAMNHWSSDGTFGVHVFHMNNELAGYCSVLHALTLMGLTGHYGRPMSAAVIGFGNTARGSVIALQGLGIHDITVLTHREVAAVASPIPGVRLEHLGYADEPGRTVVAREVGATVPTADVLAEHDVIVNCVFQDTDRPLMFAMDDELGGFCPGSVIVDVSCDAGMGFECARPTSFEEPMFEAAPGVHYYGVDHSPSYLFDASTWMISEALIPHLPAVMDGPDSWEAHKTVARAIEVRDGIIRNPKILSFQQRDWEHPHPVRVEHG